MFLKRSRAFSPDSLCIKTAILSGKMRIFREGDDFVKIKMMLKKRKGRIENDKQKGIFCAIMEKTKKKEFFA